MIRVCGPRLVLKVDDVDEEEFSEGGIYVAGTNEKRLRKAAVEHGEVISVGQTCWKAFYLDPDEFEPWCKVGDRVSFVRYAGKPIQDELDGQIYQVVNDEDIVYVIETKEERNGRDDS